MNNLNPQTIKPIMRLAGNAFADKPIFRQYGAGPHDPLQDAMSSASSSRLMKMELTGILVPCNEAINGYRCKFRIETPFRDYFLSLSDALGVVARKLEWEEVTVRGHLDTDDGLFEIEKISLTNRSEPFRLMTGPRRVVLVTGASTGLGLALVREKTCESYRQLVICWGHDVDTHNVDS